MPADDTRLGGPDPFDERGWKEIGLGLVRLIRDVTSSLPRDEVGQPTWLETRTQLIVAPASSHGEEVPYIDARGHVDGLVQLARASDAHDVLASRLPMLSNHLPGSYHSDLQQVRQEALDHESAKFDSEFLKPLLVSGVEAYVDGKQPEDWAVRVVDDLKALLEPNEPEWCFWWLISNTKAPPARRDAVLTVTLNDRARLVSIPYHERGSLHSELAEDGHGPTLGELRRCGWKLEIKLPQGQDPISPDAPAESQFEQAYLIRDQTMACLSLLTSGNPLTCWWDWEPSFWGPRRILSNRNPPCQPAQPRQHYFIGEVAEIDETTMEELPSAWERARGAWDDEDLRRGMQRLQRATRQPNETDTMRDLISTLDHLLMKPFEKGKKSKIAQRSARIVPAFGLDGQEVAGFLEDVYEARSNDTHEARAPENLDTERLREITQTVVSYSLDKSPWSKHRDALAD